MGSTSRDGRSGLRKSFLENLLQTRFDISFFLRMEIPLLVIIQFTTNVGIVPSAATYLFDLLNIIALLLGCKKIASAMSDFRGYALLLIGYVLFALVTGVASSVSAGCILWELIQQIRIPIYLLLALTYWDKADVKKTLRGLYRLQPINFTFAIVEYFVFNLTGDQCGGIFGISTGCNMMLNQYLAFCSVYACCRYLVPIEEKRSFTPLLLTLLSSFFIATLAEIKFFYFEAIIIIVVAVAMGQKNVKLVTAVTAFTVALVVGLSALAVYFPDSYEMLFNVDEMASYDDGSNVATSGYGISRVSAIKQINSLFFYGDTSERMTGYGFGSATMSSIDALCSPFYWQYGWLRYYYSPIAMLYLQGGYIGLLLYFVVILYPLAVCIKNRKLLTASSGMRGFAVCTAVLFVANCFYNASSRSYAALLWALMIAAPLIEMRAKTYADGGN